MALLLLFLLGGVAAVYVVSSSSDEGSDVMKQFGGHTAVEKAFATVVADEHFQDPIYSCFGSSISPSVAASGEVKPSTTYGVPDLWVEHVGDAPPPPATSPYTIIPNHFRIGGEWWLNSFGWHTPWPEGNQFPFDAEKEANIDDTAWGVGYEYLAPVENSANARIAAMRAKVSAVAAARGAPQFLSVQNSPIDFLALNSWKSMSAVSKSIVDTLKDATNYSEIAAAAGVSEADVQTLAQDVIDQTKKGLSDTAVIAEAAKYVTPVANVIDKVIQSAISGVQPEVTALEGIRAAGAWVPIYGQIITLAAGMLEGKLQADAAAAAAACQATTQSIINSQQNITDAKLPYPWHALTIFSATKCSGSGNSTPDQYALEEIFTFNAHVFGGEGAGRSLVLDDRVYAQRWWATAVMFMSDPRVFDIFYALGIDIYGGTVASDEQVMLVAAPIALANGITDVDDFAKRLWCRSRGWNSASPDSFVKKSFDPDACGEMTRNAWWLQWAALARDAFSLADELKGRVEPLDMLGDPSTIAHLTVANASGPRVDLGKLGTLMGKY